MRLETVGFSVDDSHLDGIMTTPHLPISGAALLLHPHPLYGGSRDDRVIRFVDDFLLNQGFATFRFNFRGVYSQADYNGIPGAIHDAEAAAQVLSHRVQKESLAVVGYSFGGSIALHLASRIKTDFLVTFSASIGLAREADDGLQPLSNVHCPTLMFHGDNDNMIPFDDMLILARKLGRSDIQTVALEGEGHFYIQHPSTTKSYLSEFLKQMTDG
jgi:alpha/beta superfamily hydrolase